MMYKIEELLKYEQPGKYIVSSTEYDDKYKVPVLTPGQTFVLGYTNEEENVFDASKEPVIIFDDFTTSVKYVDFPFKVKSSALKILHATEKCDIKYAYYLLKSLEIDTRTHKRYWISTVSQIEVPEISLEKQKSIAEALSKIEEAIDNRRKYLDDSNELVESIFKSDIFDKREEYQISELGNFFDITSSKRVFQADWKNQGIPFYRAREIIQLSENGKVDNELFITKEMYEEYKNKYGVPQIDDIMITGVGTLGVPYLVNTNEKFYFKDGNIIWLKSKKNISSKYIEYLFKTEFIKTQIASGASGATVGTYTIERAKKTKIIVPPEIVQQKLVDKIIMIEKMQKETKGNIEDLLALYDFKMNEYFGK